MGVYGDPLLHAVIAIGASAGGIDALQRLARELPGDLPAAVLVVLHIPATSRSLLPQILARHAALPVAPAADGEPLRPASISVAPPDAHLLVRQGRIALSHGPKENGVRPAIDPLFRSVAREYGAHAIAVVLSGSLHDGAAGAAAVAEAGGTVLVQAPGDAVVSSMPEAALAAAPGALTLGIVALARELERRVARGLPPVATSSPRA